MRRRCVVCGRIIEDYFMTNVTPDNQFRFSDEFIRIIRKKRSKGGAWICDTCLAS